METCVTPEHSLRSQFFLQQLRELLDNDVLIPGRAMVLGGDMIEEVELLLERGYQITLVDPTGNDINRAKQRGLSLKWATKTSFLDIKPWHVGHLDLILDRLTLNSLEPEDRFAYANIMGRFLTGGSFLAGLYRLGSGPETHASHTLTRDYFQNILGRYFRSEHPKLMTPESQGATSMMFHLLQRRSLPRRPQRSR